MRTGFLKIKNWFLLSIAGVFGLQLSCSSHNPDNAPKCIYGPPEMLNGGSRYVNDDNDTFPQDSENGDECSVEEYSDKSGV